VSAQLQILLTGATGHVGGRLFEHLAQGDRFRIHAVGQTARTLPSWAHSHNLYFGDLQIAAFRRKVLEGADVVVHLANRGFSAAAQPTADELAKEHSTTVDLARDAARSGVSRFVFLSSIHVFGESLVGQVDDTTIARPSSAYGASRLQIEGDLAQVADETGLEVLNIRMSNSFGPPAIPRLDTWNLLLHDLCLQAVRSQTLILRSDPRTYRDVIALRDAVRALAQIVESPDLSRGTYLLASGRTSTLLELADAVRLAARLVLGTTLSVEASHRDEIAPQRFDLDSSKLTSAGIAIPQHRDEEICDLLRHTQHEFGMTRP